MKKQVMEIAGFTITDTLQEGRHLVLKGHRDNNRVILKILNQQRPSTEEVSRFDHEYHILRRLNGDAPLQVQRRVVLQHQPALILEDFGGVPLHHAYHFGNIDLTDLFSLAIQIVDQLIGFHQSQVVHARLCPRHIVWSRETQHLKVIDFSEAVLLSENSPLKLRPRSEDWAYMAPEQAPQSPGMVDERTDLYSLGVILYEMLTGQLPFQEEDWLERIHSHLARAPIPPLQYQPHLPPVISDIVMKLLSKEETGRYQSSLTLANDLKHCQERYIQSGRITAFPLAQADLFRRPQLFSQIYGRETELQKLEAALQQVRSGKTLAIILHGESGLGKSTLVSELRHRTRNTHGWFVAGKFERLEKTKPHSAIVDTFRHLVRQLLTESKASSEVWRQNLKKALGATLPLLAQEIPELHFLLEVTETKITATATDHQSFRHALQQLLLEFSKSQKPIVLFWDDLQWADANSLQLLVSLMGEPALHHVFFLLACRDDTTYQAQLVHFSHMLEERGIEQEKLLLRPLPVSVIQKMVSDLLRLPLAQTEAFTAVLHQKSTGNPLFLQEFLQMLFKEGALRYEDRWQWDLEQIRQKVAPSVVNLLIPRLEVLPPSLKKLLGIASCWGGPFSLDLLSQVLNQPRPQVLKSLQHALQEGLLVQQDHQFRFVHDQVNEAMYRLVEQAEREQYHFYIGRALQKFQKSRLHHPDLFPVINHLNRATRLLSTSAERLELARWNLQALQQAKMAGAFEVAQEFCEAGMTLLPTPERWEHYYDLALAFQAEQAELNYLTANYSKMLQDCNEGLNRANTSVAQTRFTITQIRYYASQARFETGLDLGLEMLQQLGVEFPRKATAFHILKVLTPLVWKVRRHTPETLSKLPDLTDPQMLAVVDLLIELGPTAYNSNPNVFTLMMLKGVEISLSQGLTSFSVTCFTTLGAIVGSAFSHYSESYRLGLLGLELGKTLESRSARPTANLVMGLLVNHWKRPLSTGSAYFQAAFEGGQEVGDFQTASIAMVHFCNLEFFQGKSLEQAAQQYTNYEKHLQKLEQDNATSFFQLSRQWVQHCQGQVPDWKRLDGLHFQEDPWISQWTQDQVLSILALCDLIKGQLAFLYGEPKQALMSLEQAKPCLPALMGQYTTVLHTFFWCLSVSAIYAQNSPWQQRQYRFQLYQKQRILTRWARSCPENFGSMHSLVNAEIRRMLGKPMAAKLSYMQAIQYAKDQGHLYQEALTNELAAKFYVEQKDFPAAQLHFQESYYCYQRWGAIAKLQQLVQAYPHFVQKKQSTPSDTPPTNNPPISPKELDLIAILQASQALSQEIVLPHLLKKLMHIVLIYSGARKGVLLLKEEKEFLVRVSGTMTPEYETHQHRIPFRSYSDIPLTMVEYVLRNPKPIVLQDALREELFLNDPYMRRGNPKSILCTPILQQGQLIGILYLENNAKIGAFSPERLDILHFLSSQAAISIINAQQYEALERATEELRKADQLKDEFLAKTSHELRTPLQGIIGLVEAIRLQSPDWSPEVERSLSIVLQSSHRLHGLIEDILDFSQLRHNALELHLHPVSLSSIVNIVFTLSRPLADQRSLKLIHTLPSTLPPVQADENRLLQILHNLVDNALKFTEQGQVQVSVEKQELHMKVIVSDTGPGIPPEHWSRLTQPFVQGVAPSSVSPGFPHSGGLGLGLAISKQLVEQHGGELLFPTESGPGNHVAFTIPLADGPADQLPDTWHLRTKRSIQGNVESLGPSEIHRIPGFRKILVVDDDPTIRELLQAHLAERQFGVVSVSQGQQAIDVIFQENPPDLVLLDIMLPDISGYEVCRQIRERYTNEQLPILFLTAKNQLRDLVQGLELGGNDYLIKPFHHEELLARMQQQLEWALAHERMQSLHRIANHFGRFHEPRRRLNKLQHEFEKIQLAPHVLTTIRKSNERKPPFYELIHFASEILEETGEVPADVTIFSNIAHNESIRTRCGELPGHVAYLFLELYGETLALYRDDPESPFSTMDRNYLENVAQQIRSNQKNVEDVNGTTLDYVRQLFDRDTPPVTKDIIYIQSEKPFCNMVLEHYEIRELKMTLSFLEEFYKGKLLKVNRSYLVNPQKILQVGQDMEASSRGKNRPRYVLMKVGEETIQISVGRQYLESVVREYTALQS